MVNGFSISNWFDYICNAIIPLSNFKFKKSKAFEPYMSFRVYSNKGTACICCVTDGEFFVLRFKIIRRVNCCL